MDPETDFGDVSERVTFDFDADPRQIANQTPQTFRAITPHKPCYYRIDAEVQRLIDTIQRYHPPDRSQQNNAMHRSRVGQRTDKSLTTDAAR
jgi:hypothetical protein